MNSTEVNIRYLKLILFLLQNWWEGIKNENE